MHYERAACYIESRSLGRRREGGASIGIPGEIEGSGCYRNSVETRISLALGVRGCPKSALPKLVTYIEMLVSAAGLEPATHALKEYPALLASVSKRAQELRHT
jgi:hypothetical protein